MGSHSEGTVSRDTLEGLDPRGIRELMRAGRRTGAGEGLAKGYTQANPVPLFWGCGCTPQAVALASKLDFMITHKAGHLFITDTLSEEIAAL